MTDQERPPTEEEMRAAYEAELKRVRVDDVLVQTIVSLVNLGGRKAGVAPGTEDERDMDQVRMAIEGVRALFPLVEEDLGPDGARIRDALSQLQMMYAQSTGASAGTAGPPGAPPERPAPEPPKSKLWVPGQ